MKVLYRYKKFMMIISRSYKCYDKEKFLFDLLVVFFYVFFIFDDVDDQVWVFYYFFNNVVSEYVLVKCFYI